MYYPVWRHNLLDVSGPVVPSSSFPLPTNPSHRFILRSCYPVQKQLVFQAGGYSFRSLWLCEFVCMHGWHDVRHYSFHSHPDRFRTEIWPFDLSMASQGEESKSHEKYPVAKTFVCMGVHEDLTSGFVFCPWFLSWTGTFTNNTFYIMVHLQIVPKSTMFWTF